MRIYSAYDTPPDVVMDCASRGEEGRSLTRQSMKAESDINNILARYAKTGLLTHVSERSPLYLDVSEVSDYREALEQVRVTSLFFGKLPASIRTHFKNDAASFLDFMTNEDNRAEAIALGLVPAETAPVDEVPGPGIQGRDPTTGQFTSPK